MRMSRRMGLLGHVPTLRDFFASLDPLEIWQISRDSSSSSSLSIDQSNSALPTIPNYRIIFFAGRSSFVIGIYNSTNATFKKYIELGSYTLNLSGTTLSVSSNCYAGAIFMTYSSWPESEADALLSRVSAVALDVTYGSSVQETKLSTANHVSDPKQVYVTIFTLPGSNVAYFNVSPCDDIFNPIRKNDPYSELTSYLYDPSISGYVAATTIDGTSNAKGRSGGFYRLSLS